MTLPPVLNTPYCNTIPLAEQAQYPGNLDIVIEKDRKELVGGNSDLIVKGDLAEKIGDAPNPVMANLPRLFGA